MKVRGKRALLNLPGFNSTAAIVFEVEDTREKPEMHRRNDYQPSPNYTFQIANCDRSIAFEFNFYDAEERANDLHKVDTMIDVLRSGRRALAAEQRLYVQRGGKT